MRRLLLPGLLLALVAGCNGVKPGPTPPPRQGGASQATLDIDAALSALETATQAYQADPGNLEAARDRAYRLYHVGETYRDQGNTASARPYYRQALTAYGEILAVSQDPSLQAIMLYNQGNTHYRLGDLPSAEGAWKRAVSLGPAADRVRPSGEYNLGVLYHNQRRHAEARQRYLHTLELKPAHLKARFNLGLAENSLGNRTGALAAWEQAIDLAPGDPVNYYSHYNWGVLLGDEERWPEAQDHFLQAARLDPDQYLCHYNIGVAHEELGEHEAALRAYRHALELQPDFLWAEQAVRRLQRRQQTGY